MFEKIVDRLTDTDKARDQNKIAQGHSPKKGGCKIGLKGQSVSERQRQGSEFPSLKLLLFVPKGFVYALARHQVFMGTLFCNGAFVDHHDVIGSGNGVEPVGNYHPGFIFHSMSLT